eukprot:PhF_6_TR36306/c1_g1_i1/m.53030
MVVVVVVEVVVVVSTVVAVAVGTKVDTRSGEDNNTMLNKVVGTTIKITTNSNKDSTPKTRITKQVNSISLVFIFIFVVYLFLFRFIWFLFSCVIVCERVDWKIFCLKGRNQRYKKDSFTKKRKERKGKEGNMN